MNRGDSLECGNCLSGVGVFVCWIFIMGKFVLITGEIINRGA